ncbi:hypothetical protein ABE096_00950 [Robertmurraya massiliosenegalensis]|uniref:hypothetical protein n=1 Tax=Robertmurraya TaxID=2837507 RepID=UPI0039A56F5B
MGKFDVVERSSVFFGFLQENVSFLVGYARVVGFFGAIVDLYCVLLGLVRCLWESFGGIAGVLRFIAGVLRFIAGVLAMIAGLLVLIAGLLAIIAGVSGVIADLRYFYRFRSKIFYKICILSWDCGASLNNCASYWTNCVPSKVNCGAFVNDCAALGIYCASTNNWLEASSSSFQLFSLIPQKKHPPAIYNRKVFGN